MKKALVLCLFFPFQRIFLQRLAAACLRSLSLHKPPSSLIEQIGVPAANPAGVPEPRAPRFQAGRLSHLQHAVDKKFPPVLPIDGQRAHGAHLVEGNDHPYKHLFSALLHRAVPPLHPCARATSGLRKSSRL